MNSRIDQVRPEAGTASPGWARYAGLALMILVALATRLPFFGHPAADFDEQLYDLIGTGWLTGKWPFIDLWDRKPPGLFALYALAHALGGSPQGYQFLALSFCIFGGWQLCWLARRIVDPVTAAFASALYPLLMALMGSHSGQSEVFFVPFLMGMAQVLILARERSSMPAAVGLCLLAMLLGGLALQIKYTVLAQCLLFGVLALWLLRAKGMRLPALAAVAALFAIAGVAPTAFAAAVYWSRGAFDQFIFANFVSIGFRGAMPLAITWAKQITFFLPLAFLVAGGAVYGLFLQREHGNRAWRLALVWLAVAIAGLFMSRTVYPYYFAALVPPVILTALPMLDSRMRIGRIMLAGVLAVFLLIFNPAKQFAESRADRASLDRAAALLRSYVSRDHALLVYDGPLALYRMTGSGLPTPLIYPDHLNNSLEANALPLDPARELRRVFANRPGAVVTTRDTVTVRNPATARIVADELAARYQLVGKVAFQQRELELYARR